MTMDEQVDSDELGNRMAMGAGLGTLLGVVLSLVLDNWGLIGVGIALGAAFGAVPSRKGTAQDGDASGGPDRT